MTRLAIELHPEASLEKDLAFDWYAERSQQSASLFYKALEEARSEIQAAPERWAEYLHGTRRYLLKRFPFVIVYRVTALKIDIIAVAHGRQRPGYWVDRLGPSQ